MRMKTRSQFKRIWREIKWAILSMLWGLSLFLGFLGFTIYAKQNSLVFSVLDRIYLSLQLISMNSGAMEGTIHWTLQLARFLVPALTAFTAFAAVINLFREQTQWLHLWGLQDHVIVCGLGRKGRRLVDDLISNGYHVVAIDKGIDPAQADDYRRQGVIVIEGDAAEMETLESARISRASHLICLLGEDVQNLSVALQAYSLPQKKVPKNLICIIHLFTDELFNLVRKSELNLNDNDPLTLEIFNLYERQAHHLISYESAPNTAGDSRSAGMLVFGLGRLGQNLIRQAAYKRHMSGNPEKLLVVVIDKVADARIDQLTADFPQVASVCDIVAIQADLESPSIWKNILKSTPALSKISQVFICLGNPVLGVQVYLNLAEMPEFRAISIHLRLEKDSGLLNLINLPISGQVLNRRVLPFDMYEQTCSASLVFGGLHELLAIKLRENYLLNLDPGSVERQDLIPWDDISEHEKEANRQQANRICRLLKDAGYTIDSLRDWDADQFRFDPDDVLRMAKLEHELWCQWKQDDGWRYAAQRDNDHKLHPALVDWDALPGADQKKNEDFIVKLPVLLAELGFQIERA